MDFKPNRRNSNRRDNNGITPYNWGLSSQFESILDEFKHSMDQLMTPFASFMEPFEPSTGNIPSTRTPFIDLVDEGDHYRFNAELPGFTKENVDVQITRTGLILHAEKKNETNEQGENYLRRERGYSVLERSVDFPEDVNPDKADGTLNNGVLELRIPKVEVKPEERPKRVQLR